MPEQPRPNRSPVLTLVPKARGRGFGLQAGDQPMAYTVAGLPADLAVEIAEQEGRWQLMVVRDGQAGDWQGDFDSPDDVLSAIARELGHADPRSR